MLQVPAVQVKVKDNLGSLSDVACLSGETAEGAELKDETRGIRVKLGRTAKDRRERGNEESVRGIRWRMRSGSMLELRSFQLRLKARLLVHASNRNQES